MTFLLHGALVAFFVTVIATGLTAIKCRAMERMLLGSVGTFVVFTLFNWLIMWKGHPLVGISWMSFYQAWWLWTLELFVAGIIIGACGADWEDTGWPSLGSIILGCAVVVLAIGSSLTNPIYTQGRATHLASQIHVRMEKVNTYPDTDANHMVVVPEQVARRTAGQALASQGPSMSTYYDVQDPVLQSVNRHAYWVVGLVPSTWKNSNKVHGQVPGYVVVDAEDQSANAVLRKTDAEGRKFHINYQLNGSFSHNLTRYVWSHGYSDTPVEGWTLEVNDDWRPYWTASVNRLTLNFHHTVPESLITVDAQSGVIQRYDFGKFPKWVDRIYDADTTEAMLNWWGDFGHPQLAPYRMINRGSGGRYQVKGTPTLVYTKEGYPVWQVEMTSLNHDTSVAYMALFNGRDDTVRMYQIPDLAAEPDVIDTIKKSGSSTKSFVPVHLALHKIYGHLTWVAPLVADGDEDSSGVATWQGIALIPADQQLSGSNTILSTKINALQDGLANYQTLLANSSTVAAPGEDVKDVVVTGTVDEVSPSMGQGSTTVIYFTLKGDKKHDYRVTVQPQAEDSNTEIPFVVPGKKVRVAYKSTGGIIRDVTIYDDLSREQGS